MNKSTSRRTFLGMLGASPVVANVVPKDKRPHAKFAKCKVPFGAVSLPSGSIITAREVKRNGYVITTEEGAICTANQPSKACNS